TLPPARAQISGLRSRSPRAPSTDGSVKPRGASRLSRARARSKKLPIAVESKLAAGSLTQDPSPDPPVPSGKKRLMRQHRTAPGRRSRAPRRDPQDQKTATASPWPINPDERADKA